MNELIENTPGVVSIIIPTLNEERSISSTLRALARVRGEIEVIVVDGGSDDSTVNIARENGVPVIVSERGRGIQMHTGACAARGQTLLFLHADTVAPPEMVEQIEEVLSRDSSIVGGNFRVRFGGDSRPASFLTWLYPQLGKLGLRYGDSGIFAAAKVYEEIGGFKPFPIFEDLDFVQRLKKRGRLVQLPAELVTSSRRFEGRGFSMTFARWSILQILYWLGVQPRTLTQLYSPARNEGRS